MQISARGAQKKREESKKLEMYSKQWLPGDTLRVFYPIFWVEGHPEIAVGAIWGHSVSDIKALKLKTAFIPSTTEFDENGMPIGTPDVTYQFSQIARVFVNGAKMIEEAQISKKNWPTEAARKDALMELEKKYDTKNNQNAVRPIIGRAQYYISTEVISMKLVNDQPNLDSLKLSSAPLSNQTINKLYALMADQKYAPVEGDEFFEVEWKYPTDSDKASSARSATVNGLTAEYRSPVAYPDAYKTLSGLFGMVARDSETITRRATRMIDPARVRAALTQYAFLSSEYLDVASEEDEEILLNHVDLIQELDVTRALTNQELVQKIQQAVAEADIKRPNVPEEIPSITEPATASSAIPENPATAVDSAMQSVPDLSLVAGAPTMQSLMTEAAQQPAATQTVAPASMQSLLNNQNNISGDEAMLEDVDLTSMV